VGFMRLNNLARIELQKWPDKPFEDHPKFPLKASGGFCFQILLKSPEFTENTNFAPLPKSD